MNHLHPLLKRQIKQAFGAREVPPSLSGFLEVVNRAYHEFDSDRLMLERSSDLSSQELFQATAHIKKAYEQLKVAQNQLIQSEKMSAVGQLAAGVAHEINNPLGVILGFSQALVKRLKPDDPLSMPLLAIDREAQRCKQLVQSLLTFSRVGKPEKEELNLKETIESALSLILPQARVRDVQLIRELGSETLTIFAERIQIQQVVINLCNNAMDAMPKGGSLTVHVGKNFLDGIDMAEIAVIDTGEGISKENQSKIFEPFFTTKEVGKGTGLGLSLVFEIVQKHAGHITFESEPGKGTAFKVYFPVR